MQLILVGVGIALMLNGLFLMPLSNLNAGLILVFGLGLLLFCWGILYQLINKWKSNVWVNRLRYLFSTGLILMALIIAVLFAYGTQNTATYSEEILVVLGAGIRGDQVSRTLQHRLEAAYAYHVMNPKAIIILSGGQGPEEWITEAEAMKRYLIAKGVPKEKLIKEEASTSTFENFKFSLAIIKKAGYQPDSVVFITNAFHVLRAHQVARQLGLDVNHIGAAIDWYMIPSVYSREVFALLKWVVLSY